MQKDDILRKTVVYTIEGWPRYFKDASEPLFLYYHARSNLSVAENILLYDKKIVIPQTLQPDILTAIDQGHWDAEKCKSCAAQSVRWPIINRYTNTHIFACKYCNKNRSANRKKPMITHEIPISKWHTIATDLLNTKMPST